MKFHWKYYTTKNLFLSNFRLQRLLGIFEPSTSKFSEQVFNKLARLLLLNNTDFFLDTPLHKLKISLFGDNTPHFYSSQVFQNTEYPIIWGFQFVLHYIVFHIPNMRKTFKKQFMKDEKFPQKHIWEPATPSNIQKIFS